MGKSVITFKKEMLLDVYSPLFSTYCQDILLGSSLNFDILHDSESSESTDFIDDVVDGTLANVEGSSSGAR